MGGNSISVSKVLVSAMAKNYSIAYADIFDHPTPREIARHLSERNAVYGKISDEIIGYDYSKINKLIKEANINEVGETIKNSPSVLSGRLGNVIITGVTGFLGIHILKEYITKYQGRAYCLVRGNKRLSAEKRLKTLLAYYFSDDFAQTFDDRRIVCIEGELNDEGLTMKLNDVPFDTVIHCAACVKHFVSDDFLYRANTLGTQNILKICEERKKRFIHISTYSVSGTVQDEMTNKYYTENDLYIGQEIDNEYVRTKFLAERAVFEAALRGTDVKIIRLGNLMGRMSDGEFQINFVTSGFMRDLRGITALGYCPVERFDKEVEFSPIDCTSDAVLKIADSDLPALVYHVYNNNMVKLSSVIEALEKCGFILKQVSEEEYRRQILIAVKKYEGDARMSDIITGLVAYKNAETGTEPEIVDVKNSFTTKILSQLGFTWPKTDISYICKNIKILIAMGFFSNDQN